MLLAVPSYDDSLVDPHRPGASHTLRVKRVEAVQLLEKVLNHTHLL